MKRRSEPKGAVQSAKRQRERRRAESLDSLADTQSRPKQEIPGDIAWTRAIVETAVDGIIIINEQGLIEFFNPAAERLFQYEAHEVLGKNVRMLMPEATAVQHDGYIANYIRTGHAKIIGIGREVEGKRKDGTTFPMELSVSEVFLENRRIFTGIVHDVTRRKQSQLEKDKLLEDLNKRNRELMCLYRVEETIRSNRQDLSEMLNEIAALLQQASDDPASVQARIVFDDTRYPAHDTAATAPPLCANIVVGGRQRGVVELYWTESPDRDPEIERADAHGLIDAIASILGESIERREAEAQVIQASKLASIGELAAGVGHEINNPVNGILNCAEILIPQFAQGTKYRQFAELIRSEAERIARIVHSLLTFSRQEKERHSPARLCDIVEAVLSLGRRRLEKSRVVLTVDVPETLPKIRCRSEQLQQVVMNLLINALHSLDEKYPEDHPDKQLMISARVIQSSAPGHIRLTVDDHGAGIAPANMSRLFDPFFTTKGRDRGTGLGLSVSDGIVKDHGGTISVESELGHYARFHVDLPLNGDAPPLATY